jgi:hypothetical protein
LVEATPPLLVHPVTAAEVLVAPMRHGLGEAVSADLVAIGVEIRPLGDGSDATLPGCKMPDCCVLAVAATRGVAVAGFDERVI